MKSDFLVSILINNYNYDQYLKEAIDSSLNQTYPNLEIIVVDDGSQDDSVSILRQYARDNVIGVYKDNGGQASAFNAGFAESSGDIICFLDADDYFYPSKIEEVVSIFNSSPKIGWVFHQLDYIDPNNQILDIDDPSPLIQQSMFVDFRENLASGKRFTYSIPCGLCLRRSLLQQILPMPESESVTISDNYIKYAALSLSEGLFLTKKLAAQRIHGKNTYTFQSDNQKLRAEINIKTGYYLRQNYSHIWKFSEKIFSRGCGEMIAEFDFVSLWKIAEFKAYLQEYSSFRMFAQIFPKSLLYAAFLNLRKLWN